MYAGEQAFISLGNLSSAVVVTLYIISFRISPLPLAAQESIFD